MPSVDNTMTEDQLPPAEPSAAEPCENLASASASPVDAENNENDPPSRTLEDAQRLYDEGCAAFRSGDYEQAAELLSRCLEIRALHYGELAIECAFTYYKYGCALLYKAQNESDPLGEMNEANEPSDGAGEPAKEEPEDEDLEEEEESDLDMAWKMLDIARVIYEKQQSHTMEEVDVIIALADVSLEREDFEMCFRDYTKALEIMEGLVERDHRGIAELCFKLCLAHQLGYKPKDALRYCQQAVSVCEARLKRLRNEVAISNGTADVKGKSVVDDADAQNISQNSVGEDKLEKATAETDFQKSKTENEITEIEQLLEDLKEKVSELEGMASGPSLLDSLKETNPAAVDSIKRVFSATAQLAALPGENSSHMETLGGSMNTTSGSASAASVTHLGVVGRGVKRATPIPVSGSSNNQESVSKKRTLDDMLTKGGSGETQIGFGTDSTSN